MISYQNIPAFIDYIYKNPFPNKDTILQIEINSVLTVISIYIYNTPLNARSKKSLIELITPTNNDKLINDSLEIDNDQYQIMINTLKNIYEIQNLEIDYFLIGDFIKELNEVFPIVSGDLNELLEV